MLIPIPSGSWGMIKPEWHSCLSLNISYVLLLDSRCFGCTVVLKESQTICSWLSSYSSKTAGNSFTKLLICLLQCERTWPPFEKNIHLPNWILLGSHKCARVYHWSMMCLNVSGRTYRVPQQCHDSIHGPKHGDRMRRLPCTLSFATWSRLEDDEDGMPGCREV